MKLPVCLILLVSLSIETARSAVCYWTQGKYGVNLNCPSGWVGSGACGSGGNADCKKNGNFWVGFWASLKCCHNSNAGNRFHCHTSTGSWGQKLECSSEKSAFGLCGSGRNADCGNNVWNKLTCCSSRILINSASCYWKYGTYGTYLECAAGEVLTGICGSGMNADCPHNSFHGIKCCKGT